jgi:phytoene desaturase
MKKIVVVGGGLGGIAAALRARALGHQVTLVDKLPSLGGRAQGFKKAGYHHDAGPTVLTAPFLIDELFQLFNKNRADYVEFKPLPIWYRFVFDDGSVFNYGGDEQTTLAAIEDFSPDDLSGYHNLLEASRNIYQLGFEQLAHQPFHNLAKMLGLAPSMLKLNAHQSVWQFVGQHISSEKLRQALSIQPLLVGGNPTDTTCIYSLIHFLERKHGVFFAMGGTTALIQALGKLMQEEGIEIKLNSEVTGFSVDNKAIRSVHIQNEQMLECDHLISNIDPLFLYKRLLNKEANFLAKLRSNIAKPSMGLFVLYFGATVQYPDCEHHTIIMGKHFEPLLDSIFKTKVLSQDISIYLHRPTATDPSLAPEGCESFYALVPVPNLKADIDWDVEGPKLKELLLSRLSSTVLPDIEKHCEQVFYKTPKDFLVDYNSEFGSGFSIAPIFFQSAWFRFHNKGEGITNLSLCGAGSHPGAGIPGVISSAKVVESLLKTEYGSDLLTEHAS